ncbi:precorrin-6y C5,15-methyltransferase (decarboxylating) subunit CbiE [Solwaraspora sp. WMMA2056]|uniref:precorrin-6y C5,15-methyltransferase (decarboxylating) subunit CbiE n=1 Tax=Solwaraspora sp. WMMA2056 TaxID=3015161 RepID=UPI00259BA054|nr:precorrin-6y C5,15-methyltransferase (decarboxylating) subunit CbiE [Solwaraspora sp. WMMA2056]WJK39080.1 precorrin-6y C5,15-methyltransferase (decarboxylating) subunit CbiE [Solwaraspora sp. WMMA2056]
MPPVATPARITVVGIGADGWDGLCGAGRAALRRADVLMGSRRQIDVVPPPHRPATTVTWPTPLLTHLPRLLDEHQGRRLVVLASGDPMHFGIGATLMRLVGADRVHAVPHPSAASLACARLGWPVEETDVVSTVGRPVQLLHPRVQPDRRLLVLSAGPHTPGEVAALLTARGYGPSTLTLLEQLGGPSERIRVGTAADWAGPQADPLNVVAVHCRPAPDAPTLPTVPGLPDDTYRHDGQLTKREVRAITLARLAPAPGQLLWDVGAGSGSIAIEWARVHPQCRAIAVERHPQRAERITTNAAALGVPGVRVLVADAPAALAGLPPPDAVFVGGGVTTAGLLESAWAALRPGGRLVANAVTMESEVLLADWYARHGGDLTRIAISRAAPVGGFTGWRPARPVTQWAVHRR